MQNLTAEPISHAMIHSRCRSATISTAAPTAKPVIQQQQQQAANEEEEEDEEAAEEVGGYERVLEQLHHRV